MKKIIALLLIFFPVFVLAEDYLVPVKKSELLSLKSYSRSFYDYETVCVAENCYFVMDKAGAEKMVQSGVADSFEPVIYIDLILPVVAYSAQTNQQWALNSAAVGWKSAKTNYMDALSDLSPTAGPVIAVIDSGMSQHKDLYGVNNQYNIFLKVADGTDGKPIYGYTNKDGMNGTTNGYIHDDSSHGTYVSGIAGGATTDNAMGGASFGKAHIIPFQASISEDKLSSVDILKAISKVLELKAAGMDIVVVNMSYGSYIYSDSASRAMESLYNAGIIAVVAAGNERTDIGKSPTYPASYNFKNIIAVAALKDDLRLDMAYTNYGGVTAIAAPGSAMYSSSAFFSGADVPPGSNPIGTVYQSANTLNAGLESVGTGWSVVQSGGERRIVSSNSTAGSAFTVSNLNLSGLSSYAYKAVVLTYQASSCGGAAGCAELTAQYDNGNWTRLAPISQTNGRSLLIASIPDGASTMTLAVKNTVGGADIVIYNLLVGASDNTDAYEIVYGTSMAAPFIAGTLAAAKALYPEITPQQLVTLLYDKATRSSLIDPAAVEKSRQVNVDAFLAAVNACKSAPGSCAYITDYPERPVIAPKSTSVSISVSRGISCSIHDGRGGSGFELLFLAGTLIIYRFFRDKRLRKAKRPAA